jgi:hypothetical protein
MDERRSRIRVRSENDVTVRFLHVPGLEKPPAQDIVGRTTDISSHGARLSVVASRVDARSGLSVPLISHIPVGSVASVCVVFAQPRARFDHVATVRWARRESESPVFVLGFEVTGSTPRAVRAWHEYLEKNLGLA